LRAVDTLMTRVGLKSTPEMARIMTLPDGEAKQKPPGC